MKARQIGMTPKLSNTRSTDLYVLASNDAEVLEDHGLLNTALNGGLLLALMACSECPLGILPTTSEVHNTAQKK